MSLQEDVDNFILFVEQSNFFKKIEYDFGNCTFYKIVDTPYWLQIVKLRDRAYFKFYVRYLEQVGTLITCNFSTIFKSLGRDLRQKLLFRLNAFDDYKQLQRMLYILTYEQYIHFVD